MSAFLEGVRNRIFPLGIPLSWLQLIGERKRFFAAIAGVTFAVTLMMYQMGIYVAIFEKVVYPHRAMRGDLVMTNRDYNNLYSNSPFTIRRLEQALSIEGVESVAPLYLASANMRNPETMQTMRIYVFGILPGHNPFALPEVGTRSRRALVPGGRPLRPEGVEGVRAHRTPLPQAGDG